MDAFATQEASCFGHPGSGVLTTPTTRLIIIQVLMQPLKVLDHLLLMLVRTQLSSLYPASVQRLWSQSGADVSAMNQEDRSDGVSRHKDVSGQNRGHPGPDHDPCVIVWLRRVVPSQVGQQGTLTMKLLAKLLSILAADQEQNKLVLGGKFE